MGEIVTLGSNFVTVMLSVVRVKVVAPFSSNPREPIEKGLGRKKKSWNEIWNWKLFKVPLWSFLASAGGKMVEQSTRNLKVEGSSLSTDTAVQK